MCEESATPPSPADKFVKFDYAETKDLCKSFLTVISAILVFSVAFSEKIVGLAGAGVPTKWLMAAAWGSLIVAAIGTGVGLYLIFNAGQIASHQRDATVGEWQKRYPLIRLAQLIYRWNPDARVYSLLARGAFDSLTLAGVIFVLGLAALVLAALLSLFGAPRSEIDAYVRLTDGGRIYESAPFQHMISTKW